VYTVYLGLGSNLGDRLDNLNRAVNGIGAIADLHSLSSIYETEPVGMDSQEYFLNMAVEISTPHDPPLLMVQLKAIEKKVGRKLPSHMEPRIIDIDILLYRGLAYQDHTVRVPHAMLEHRRFALEPLCEIAPTAVDPVSERTVAWMLRHCRDNHAIVRTEYHLNLTTSLSMDHP
jgi:2-amino-4-hydroxy-6-hydroxymethyldihydropteridine diphosphokinase